MTVELPRIAILGTGSMGGAILAGLTAPGVAVDGGIRVTNRTEVKASALRTGDVTSLSTEVDPDANAIALAGARVAIIGVKPGMVDGLLREVAASLEEGTIIVSVAAGVTTAAMEAAVPNVVVRAMPNTPSLVGMGVTGIAAGSRADADDLALVRAVFETVGSVLEVPEDKIDALSTVSGSGPAYVFYLIEQLTASAIDLGFTPEQAELMVGETFRGAAELLSRSDDAPAELRRRVTSPGGTTERAIAELETGGLKELFDRATASALARAREIAAE
ncbi:MAG: pyrroline-5-carboxylate reductase [Microbacteriaceae bacterium]